MRAIMDQYNVQIIPRPKQKNFHAMTIVVKGCEWECARVKEATLLLMEHLCKVRNSSYLSTRSNLYSKLTFFRTMGVEETPGQCLSS